MTGETRNCQSCKAVFVIEPEDFKFYEKIQVPPPTWCPECRAKRRLVWRGQRTLYRKKSDATGKEIFTMFHPDTPYKIYESEYWLSDSWDPMQYGREIDWHQPFLAQLRKLEIDVPKNARSIENLEASDYSNNATNLKNCYLVFAASDSENSLYNTGLTGSRDCIDCTYVFACELCYECVMCDKCFGCLYSVDCADCREVILSKNCFNCSNCFGCVNLRNKEYCIFNKQYSKEEYEGALRAFDLKSDQSIKQLKEKSRSFWLTHPARFTHSARSENVTGEYIFDSINIKDGYVINGAEGCSYCQISIPTVKDCRDFSLWGNGAELIYETVQSGNGISRLISCFDCFPNCLELQYSLHCKSSSYLFGCIGLRNKKYCILNKQYSENEYFKFVERLKAQMNEMPYVDANGREYRYGEFLPPEFAPYGYNESLAYELYPVSRKEAEEQGFGWRKVDEREYPITLSASALPDSIDEADDGILKQIIGCAHNGTCDDNCTTAFQILPQELMFYRKYNVPLPRLCHNCRYFERSRWRNSAKLFARKCQCVGEKSENSVYKNTRIHSHGSSPCSSKFKTTYAPDRKEIVYCDECYKAEVI